VSYWLHPLKGRQLREKGNYKDGKKDGRWVGYNLGHKETGTFKNGVKVE